MFKKSISYIDYNDQPQTEVLYFNLNKTELMDMEYGGKESFLKRLQTLIASEDMIKGLEIIKDIILAGYGIKSEDGKRFIKNDQIREEFKQTEAYSELFLELGGNAASAAEFVNGLLPKDLLAQAHSKMAEDSVGVIGQPPVNQTLTQAPTARTSEDIRRESLAQMQGFKKAVEPEVKTSPVDISALTPEQKAALLAELS